MKRIWSWLLGILVAAPISFMLIMLFLLFALALYGGIYFFWMFD